MTVAEGTGLGSRMTAYRWHLLDPVPFQKSLKFDIEHKGWTFNTDGSVKSGFGERVDLMSSVAFWYQEGIALDQPPVPYGAARLPQGNALQIEVERDMAAIKGEKGKISMFPDLFWSKDVVVFEGEGPGSQVTIPFDVPEDGDYELYVQFAKGSNYGVYTVLLDGKPPVAPVLEHEPGADVRPQTQFDGYALETYVGADYQVGWPRLSKGRHTLTFQCLGKRGGLERLRRRRRRHRAREDRAGGLGRGREDPGAAQSDGKRGRPREGAVRPEPGDARPRRDGSAQRGAEGASRAAAADGGPQGHRSERASHGRQRHRRRSARRPLRPCRSSWPRAPSRTSRSTSCEPARRPSARSASRRRRRLCRS